MVGVFALINKKRYLTNATNSNQIWLIFVTFVKDPLIKYGSIRLSGNLL